MVHDREDRKKGDQTGIPSENIIDTVLLVSTDKFATERLQTMKIFTFVILAWWSLIRFLLTSRSCEIKKSRSLSFARYTRYFIAAAPPSTPHARIEPQNFVFPSVPLANFPLAIEGPVTQGGSLYRNVRFIKLVGFASPEVRLDWRGSPLFTFSFLPFLEISVPLPVFVPAYWR